MNLYRFKYGASRGMTVTVKARNLKQADLKARGVMDRRYEKIKAEPPVSWTLELVKVVSVD